MRRKREKIYATKHHSTNNNSRHKRGMAIVNEDLSVVNETTWKVKFQSKGKNINIFDCFWFHLYHLWFHYHCYYYYIIIIIIITNLSIVWINNILQRSMYIKTSSHQNFAQS